MIDNINWYPGHMAKTKRQIAEDLRLIDVVIEILDARIPVSSQNPDMRELTKNKKKIVILKKPGRKKLPPFTFKIISCINNMFIFNFIFKRYSF